MWSLMELEKKIKELEGKELTLTEIRELKIEVLMPAPQFIGIGYKEFRAIATFQPEKERYRIGEWFTL
jgi:hypothetical protein